MFTPRIDESKLPEVKPTRYTMEKIESLIKAAKEEKTSVEPKEMVIDLSLFRSKNLTTLERDDVIAESENSKMKCYVALRDPLPNGVSKQDLTDLASFSELLLLVGNKFDLSGTEAYFDLSKNKFTIELGNMHKECTCPEALEFFKETVRCDIAKHGPWEANLTLEKCKEAIQILKLKEDLSAFVVNRKNFQFVMMC